MIENLAGERFGRLTVTKKGEDYKHPTGYSRNRWECLCDCGKTTLVHETSLTGGSTKSCGCLATGNAKSHGMSDHPTYRKWASMKTRCNNENIEQYSDYGGRGISYDPAWECFENFHHDMAATYFDGAELDRKDVNLGYSAENCRWVDVYTQAYNKRLYSSNTSGKVGVSYRKDISAWVARINVKGERLTLGRFNNKEDAIKARESAEIEFYGEIKGV